MNDSVFDYKSPNFAKLIRFGFSEEGGIYSYATTILNGQFELSVQIISGGEIKTKVVDLNTDEPYTLHLVAEAGGAFVGSVRAEYERVLSEIARSCFETDVFAGDSAHAAIDYVRETYGDELEYLWKTFPSNAVWRRKDNRKWYGVLLVLAKRKLGLDSDEKIPVLDVRAEPAAIASLVDGERFFPGYHMNKRHWLTVCLDGSVSVAEICALIDRSYVLAK